MFFRPVFLLLSLTAVSANAQSFQPLGDVPPLAGIESHPNKDAIIELGNMLFFDARLSGDGSTSCADCHTPEAGWGDATDLSRGYPGTAHWRNSQTLVNSAYLTSGLHWDSEVASLTAQVHGAMGTSFVSNIDELMAEERLRQIPEYVERFEAIWGDKPNLERISIAIAAYERTLVSDDSPFDMYLAGQSDALSPAAQRGLAVFTGKGNCVACHNGPLITDESFHNTSVPPNPSLTENPLLQVTFRFLMRNSGIDPEVYNSLDRDPGRYRLTGDPQDLGAMRTPPLRYLNYTAPYMHSGVFYTLEEVVDFYNDGGTEDVFGTKSADIRPLGLTQPEKDDLVAFLKSLSGSEVIANYPELPDYTTHTITNDGATVTVASLKARPGQGKMASSIPGYEPAAANLAILPAGADPSQQADPAAAAKRIVEIGDDRFVVVQDGDTLGSLAVMIYGSAWQYQDIFDANLERISNPHELETGTLLLIP